MTVAELFAAAADRLQAEQLDVSVGKIMHSTGLQAGGKTFGFPRGDVLVLKLPQGRVDELVAAGARRFDANKGRPMREWVCVVPADVDECVALLAEARTFVAPQRELA